MTISLRLRNEYGLIFILTIILSITCLSIGCETAAQKGEKQRAAALIIEKQKQDQELILKQQQEEASARKIKEELGEEIECRINGFLGGRPEENMKEYTEVVCRNLKGYIQKEKGLLTIKFDSIEVNTNFSGRLGNSLKMLPVPFLVRLFDANGNYLAHFETVPFICLGVQDRFTQTGYKVEYIKEKTNISYNINLRDASYVKMVEFGYTMHK